jgi:PHD/YefM family antitoxin component YafN of YafNO toxin-antitoxin module
MRTETLTYLKENANNLELTSPLLVTQNGKARYVVQSVEDYEFQQDSLALLKMLTLSEKSSKQNMLTLDEAFTDL